MEAIQVELLEHTKLSNIVIGGRICYNSFHLGGNYSYPTDSITKVDTKYLDRLINKHGHASISRHVQYIFKVEGISTKTLLGLSRHQIGTNLSVMSSRFCKISKFGKEFTETPNEAVNALLVKHIAEIVELSKTGKPAAEDLAMLYPQAMQYDLIVSMNPQSLRHFLDMRLGKASHAHFDIQKLAELLLKAIPESHRFLYPYTNDNIPIHV